MDDRIRIEVEADHAAHDALSEIATNREQSVGVLPEEAMPARLEIERDLEEGIREGLAEIRAGRTISHEEHLARASERSARRLAQRQA